MNTTNLNIVELKQQKFNKEKARADLQQWIDRHSPSDDQYTRIVADRNALNEEIAQLDAEIHTRGKVKPFERTLNESMSTEL